MTVLYAFTLNLSSALEAAEQRLFPLKEVRAGLVGTGRTVFSGDRIEDFRVEILGVLENAGPKQSIILARLSGGPIERTGVIQGMSGSPVYVDGRLLGAVALAFPFSKEPIAGIRPIEEMLRVGATPAAPRLARRLAWNDRSLTSHLPQRELYGSGEQRLIDIATPVSFSGFTRATVEQFAPQLRSLGLEPMQGLSGGAGAGSRTGDGRPIEPGSMISVQLVTGDMNIGADGTVTHVDGNRIYAFGHRFLAAGQTDLPFSRSSVLTLLPNLASSFKISATQEWLGAITADTNAAIAGELGRRAVLAPATIEVAGAGHSSRYDIALVNDPLLAPVLLQMALYSAIDSTERVLGQGTVSIKGRFEFEGQRQPLELSNMYAGDFNVPLQVTLGTAMPLAYALQNNVDNLKLKSIHLAAAISTEKKQLQIDQVWASKREARPGDEIEVSARFAGPGGQELIRKFKHAIPIGAPAGPMQITVADGSTTNSTEYRLLALSEPRSAGQLIAFLNGLRGNTKAYARIWRADPAYQIQGEDLPDPPPSLGMILAKAQTSAGALPRTSRLAEHVLDAGDFVVNGSKTIQVEIKE